MGHVYQETRIAARRMRKVRALVDTGSTYCLISPDLARSLGITRPRYRTRVTLATGKKVTMDMDAVILTVNGREGGAFVLIGPAKEPILGVEALEVLGLTVDPRRRTLVPTRPYAVRFGGFR